VRRLLAPMLAAVCAAGCSTAVPGVPVAQQRPQGSELVLGYFAALNDAGEQGADEQADFLRRTQHPDFDDRLCDLGGLVLGMAPVADTLRPDPGWAPNESDTSPRGEIYVIAVTVTIRRGATTLGEQIGSQRVVVLDGKAFGFTPCPAS
jgi:hypothetical protein